MATRGRRSVSKPVRFGCGPFEGVRDIVDTGSQDYRKWAQDALNCYLPDEARGRSLYARPGVKLQHALAVAGNDYTSSVLHHTLANGTEYRFAIVGPYLFRIAADGLTSTNVTPAGTAISTTNRTAMLSFGDSIVVNDGVDRPWIMSTLGGTPVTRTYIDYDGAGTAWTAYGRPTIAAAKLIWIVNTLNGVYARNAIIWSEEGEAATGYQQSGYDNLWELTQTDQDALTALVGTNSGIVVFRADSHTRIEGLAAPEFRTFATFDGLNATLGCPYWATVVRVGSHIWFAGRDGKVYRLHEDGQLDEAWRAMAQTVERRNAEAGGNASLTLRACAAYHADLDIVAFALWEGTGATVYNPRTLYVFSGGKGRYCGRWQLGSANLEDADSGVEVLGLAPLKDSAGRYSLCFITTRPNNSGIHSATLRRLFLASERTYSDSWEHSAADAADSQYYAPGIRTHLMGDSAEGRVVIERVVTEHPWDPDDAGDVVKLKYHTPSLAASGQLEATLSVGTDRDEGGHARAVFGLSDDAQGRWIRITSSATFAANTTPTSNVQFGFERITAVGRVIPDVDEF